MRDKAGAAALIAVFGLLVAVGCYRIPPVDVPWHLELGRLIVETGHFPVTNTFSWTFPDQPMTQQYPIFQPMVYLLVDRLGFGAFSLVNLVLWTGAALLWARAAGTWTEAARQPLLWFLVVLGIQRHHQPRPEVFTLLGLGLILACLEAWRRGHKGMIAGAPLATWMMVNGHQFWPLAVAIQVSWLVHLGMSRVSALTRLGFSDEDRDLAVLPPVLALLVSLVLIPLSPLGLRVYAAPLTMADTLAELGGGGAAIAEFLPIWYDPTGTIVLAILIAVCAVRAVRARGRWSPFDFAVLAMGLVLVGAASRGLPIAAACAGVFASRMRARSAPLLPDESPVHIAAALACVMMCAQLGWQLSTAPATLLGRQPGFGRTVGDWADPTVAFLRESPPPGEMLNLGFVAGNPMIRVYPVKRVFVDPRLESYPRDFLHEAMAAERDPVVLNHLLAEWEPGFVVGEMRIPTVQGAVADLLDSGGWALVHADSMLVVVVRRSAESAAYLAEYERRPEDVVIADYADDSRPVLLAQQRSRVARLWVKLGRPDLAEPLLVLARRQAQDPHVAAELATMVR